MFDWLPLNNPFLWIFSDNTTDESNPDMRNYSIGTLNVQNNPDMPPEKVFECGKIVDEHNLTVIMFQEIAERDDVKQLQDAMPNHRFYCTESPTPIAVNKSKEVVNSGWDVVIKPEAGFTPPRGYAWVDINLGFTTIRVVNNHLINKAWNRKPDPRKTERRILWQKQYTATNAFINGTNRTTFFGGDYNRITVKPYAGGKWLYTAGIDKTGVTVRNGEQVRMLTGRTVETPSDHPLVYTRVSHG